MKTYQQMTQPINNQEFYTRLDETCLRLREVGLDAEAGRISHLLHKVAWTSTSELFEQLESAFEGLLHGPSAAKFTAQLKEELADYLNVLADL